MRIKNVTPEVTPDELMDSLDNDELPFVAEPSFLKEVNDGNLAEVLRSKNQANRDLIEQIKLDLVQKVEEDNVTQHVLPLSTKAFVIERLQAEGLTIKKETDGYLLSW